MKPRLANAVSNYHVRMSTSPRYLTKSRFKLALECPTKLYYTGKPEYLDTSLEDSFLAALAEGGHQVGALACVMYPGGIAVTGRSHADQLAMTRDLLQQENVTLYEAAFEAKGLFVRVDVLRKQGNRIELIEVKAKSYNPLKDGDFRGKSGALKSDILPYLQDIAFQRHVAELARPEFEYQCYLMLADSSRQTSVAGLNQRFKLVRKNGRASVEVQPGTDLASIGDLILNAVGVTSHVDQILHDTLELAGVVTPFAQAVDELADAYRSDRLIAPMPGAKCASCQFKSKTPPAIDENLSGFHECWKNALGWSDADFADDLVLDLYNSKRKEQLIQQGAVKLKQLSAEDIKFDGSEPGPEGMTTAHRQWYQITGQWPGGGDYFLDSYGLGKVMESWRYPLHFIDFETSVAPIPFFAGRKPYQTTAFQFSHHVMHEDGRVEHKNQFLDATPGVCPNVKFLRALKEALSLDEGTIFRWADHENSVLLQLRRQVLEDPQPPEDASDLIAFIEHITSREVDGSKLHGPRTMVDLRRVAEHYYFHPDTNGSSSLKKVLPAVMKSSSSLKALYGKPVYGTAEMPSLNFTSPMVWWQESDQGVIDPYKLLPPVFPEMDVEEQERQENSLPPEIREGGSAMAAFALLQESSVQAEKRNYIVGALLRYCELDTLAMVMTLQSFREDSI